MFKGKLIGTTLESSLEMTHWALTSEDPTNLAMSLILSQAKDLHLVPAGWDLVDALVNKAVIWKTKPMLSRTHGREAPATLLGKEAVLYAHRLARKIRQIQDFRLTGKLSGVVGNYHDQSFSVPNKDWVDFSYRFVNALGLEPQLFSTQIEPHDRWAELLNMIGETMVVLQTTDENFWLYIVQDYLGLPPREGQIGSSVMPHKGRNAIDLEHSEGHAIISRIILGGLADELPQSRLQRHLSDSVLARYIGTGFAQAILAFDNASSDILDFFLKEGEMAHDLDNRWSIVTSGIQTNLRRLGVSGAYEALDNMAKSGPITQERLHSYLNSTEIKTEEIDRMLTLTPRGYIGEAARLIDLMVADILRMEQGLPSVLPST